MFRRQFWLNLLVFAVLTGMAYTLSRFVSAYNRVQFMRNQADFVMTLVSSHHGDTLAFVRDLRKKTAELSLPFDIDVVGDDGLSRLTGQPVGTPRETRDIVRMERRLRGSSTRLVVSVRPPVRIRLNVTVTFVALFIALVLASALSVFLSYTGFRDKAELAKSVFSRMQQGDLKARFPTSRWDEFSQVPVLFNQMADEIERLVDQLKEKEKARAHLLQELAHDLRTPVSSLGNLLESLRFGAGLNTSSRDELTALAFQETEYLTRLVEDLLFLALVLEPKYKAESHPIDLTGLVRTQLTAVSAAYPRVRPRFPADATPVCVTGNPHQLNRLLRNGLENAFSFARERVEVALNAQADRLTVIIRDDGPGCSPQALENFGKKRSTRYQAGAGNERLSVGLGSVIMQAIVSAHGGTLKVTNRLSPEGKIVGADLLIHLPVTRPNADPA